jgi:hypothetical protein
MKKIMHTSENFKNKVFPDSDTPGGKKESINQLSIYLSDASDVIQELFVLNHYVWGLIRRV